MAEPTGWQRPTLAELIERISDDLNGQLEAADARVPRSLLWVLARVYALLAFTLYGVLAFIGRQMFVHLAGEQGVLLHATDMGVERLARNEAVGNVTFIGDNGAEVSEGTELVRADGAVYETTAAGTIAGGTATVAVVAREGGVDGNAAAGTILTVVSPIVGVNSAALVAAGGLAGGTDEESVEELRTRVWERKKRPPQGGAEADYVAWARESGLPAKVWVAENVAGLNSLAVLFVLEPVAGGAGADILPGSSEVAAVQAQIDAVDAEGHATRKPVGVLAVAAAPAGVPVAYSLEVFPDTEENREAALLALDQMHVRKAGDPVVRLSDMWLALGSVDSIDHFEITAPTEGVVVTATQCAHRGDATWPEGSG